MTYWRGKVALVTGGSAGFGKVLAHKLLQMGARVAIAARDKNRLAASVAELGGDPNQVSSYAADVTCDEQVQALFDHTLDRFGRLDMLVNNAGRSSRGNALATSADEFQEYLELNFLATARCTRAAARHLIQSRGHLVNMGSLASKTVARYLGAYPPSKFAVAAYTHQVRLELASEGVHVLLVCPGPIAHEAGERRYEKESQGLPAAAGLPGVGVRLKGIQPEQLANRILSACQRRRPELVLPGRAKLLFALAQIAPAWGDWITAKMTSKHNGPGP